MLLRLPFFFGGRGVDVFNFRKYEIIGLEKERRIIY
jgi:hypothetical protein